MEKKREFLNIYAVNYILGINCFVFKWKNTMLAVIWCWLSLNTSWMKDVSFSDCLIYRILKLQRLNEPSRAHCINVVLIALVGLSSGEWHC